MKKHPFRTLILSTSQDPHVPLPSGPVRDRLRDAFCRLHYMQLVREYRRDPLFGKEDEEQIVGRELLELALHEASEQMERDFDLRGGEASDN